MQDLQPTQGKRMLGITQPNQQAHLTKAMQMTPPWKKHKTDQSSLRPGKELLYNTGHSQ